MIAIAPVEDTVKTLLKEDDVMKDGGILTFNPYNPLNVEIILSDVQTILSTYGVPITVTNINLYQRAFVHSSYTRRPAIENTRQNIIIADKPEDCLPLSTKSNQRLEFLGDGVLELITKYELYRRFPKENEKFMTEKKIAIINNEAIGMIAYEMGLHKWLLLSRHAEEKKDRTNIKKLGCLFESFLGALFLDANKLQVGETDNWYNSLFTTGPGFQMAQKFIENVYEKHVNWTNVIQNDDNYKNILQVKIQKEFKLTPHYIQMSIDNPNGYEMGVYLAIGHELHTLTAEMSETINTLNITSFSDIHQYVEAHGSIFLFLGKGEHKIKRKAQQIACLNAIELFEGFGKS